MRKRVLLSLIVAGALPFLSLAKTDVAVPTGKKRLSFVENKGQVHDQNHNGRTDIQFALKSKGMSLFIGDGQLHYQFYKLDKAGVQPGKSLAEIGKKATPAEYTLYRMDVELIGANTHAQAVKEGEQQFVERYYSGLNKKGMDKVANPGIEAHSYNKVTYKDVYPNIDWVVYTKNDQVEYDFVVRPGGNPADIRLRYKGANAISVNASGSLTATTPLGSVTEAAPYSYQQDGKEVASSFNLNDDVLSFNVGQYTGTLVIDPALAWGTYFGDAGDDEYNGLDYDGAGNLYAVGGTNSLTNMATTGAFLQTNQGLNDGFISKFDVNGTLAWSTYFGFAGDDNLMDVDYNAVLGILFAIGLTDINGDLDASLGLFDPTGSFVNNIVIGAQPGENEIGISVQSDVAGNTYLCGWSDSYTDLATPGVLQDVNAGSFDGWIWKIDNFGTIVWGTYYGGPGDDVLTSVGADAAGNVYMAGATSSINDISTLNAFGGGSFDAFAAKINSSATVWLWGRYFGGSGDEEGLFGEVDASGNLFMTGYTNSTGLGQSGFQNTLGGGIDAFVARLTNAGAISWSSYFGGSGDEQGNGLCLSSSSVYIGGLTTSSNLSTSGGFQTTYAASADGFMARIGLTGTLTWGSYYGGNGDDEVNAVATDNTSAYCAGITSSTNNISLNTTEQPVKAAGLDAFIAKINECTVPNQPGAITGAISVCAGSTQTYTISSVTGATSYTWTLPNGWTGTSTTTSISATAGTTGGNITVTANNTCGSSLAQTLAVTVNPVPTASITPVGPTTFCQGGSVVLNANTGNGYSYQWFNGTTPVATTASYTANASGTYTVQITANGCSATSGAVTVTVNPTPTVTASSNSAVCVGGTLNLIGGSTTTGATFDWTGPNNFTNTQNPVISNAQLSDAGVYTLTVTANGCTASATTTVVVATGAPATPSAITGLTTVCAGTTNSYSVVNDVNASQYNWTLPTGWSGASTTNTIGATAGAAGSVTISVTAQNGCGTSAASTLNVTVNALPTPTITQAGSALNTTGTFTSYQWYNGTTLIPGATSQNYTPITNGNYHVVVTDNAGCSNQSNSITFSLGVNSVSMTGQVTLYPNPNTGSFTLNGAFASNDGKVTVQVVDIAGRIVHKEQISVNANELNTQINMNVSLAPGVYTLKLSSDAENMTIPFVKK